MKVKHIISIGGILLGGMVLVQAANAVVTYKNSANVQFTFTPSLTMDLEPATQGGATDFIIEDLAPGNSKVSNQVNVVVNTTNAGGYTMSATVGSATYDSTDLELDQDNVFSMISSGTALAAGEWGYTLNGSAATPTYASLPLYTAVAKTLNKTTDPTGTAATNYQGGNSTPIWIGAYADTAQLSGTYLNVVNFFAVSNIATYTVTVAAGDNVASVTPATALSYDQDSTVAITATCEDGYTFNNWANSTDFGSITDSTSSSTNFIVGPGNTTLTAYCK